ncbi:phosphatidylserine decarboxylase family protein [Flavobacteriales bacterium]|nr:phosphatidylserine decarboxylase family protein [Flavobacteriales bacterium]
MTLHREGYGLVSFAASSALVAVGLLFWLEAETWLVQLVGVLGLLDVVLIAQFFRIPKRVPVAEEGQILCPSDGKVVVIEEVEESEVFGDKRIQVSIFMSPLNVHAQWAPMAGVVTHANYHPGKYLVAWHPKSSTENERTTLVINGARGPVLFRQIAGAVARRIRWYIEPGQQVELGEEVGFIKFGSRIDVFLPLGSDIHVGLEQKVKGRETVLATLPANA